MSTDVHTLSGAYALNALSPEESADFRRHLAGCQACRDEVRELQIAAALMGAAETETPPPGLRARVLAAADRTPQMPPVAPVVPLQRGGAEPGRRRWLPRLVAAAAMVILVGGGVALVQGGDDEPTAPQLVAAAAAVFEAEDARVLTVNTKNGGKITVGVSPERNEMAVDARSLPKLDEQHVYQLWTVHNGQPTSAGVLGSRDTGAAMGMPGEATKVAVTVEPTGGSTKPTTEPIVLVDPAAV